MMYSIRIFSSTDDELMFVCHCNIEDIYFLIDHIDFYKSGFYFKIEVL